jgi:hypothetical protein
MSSTAAVLYLISNAEFLLEFFCGIKSIRIPVSTKEKPEPKFEFDSYKNLLQVHDPLLAEFFFLGGGEI